ncbi:MAG: hypothetical protein IKX29_08410 [Bacteroidales bacterium]|nr:hypothetical protein [Bacteroidales bacterium]
MEDMRKDAAWQKTVEIVLRGIKENIPHELIARLTDLTVEQVKEIAGQRSA